MIKNIIYLIITFCCLNIFSANAQWVAKEEKGKYGYVDSSGKVQIPYQYSFVFSDTLNTIAFVAVGDKIKAIDKGNNILFTAFTYDNGPDYEEEGVFRIVDDATNKMGFANMQGEIVVAPTFDFVLPFSEGLSAVNIGGEKIWFEDGHYAFGGGKWGYIDKMGNIVFPFIFDNAESFQDNKAEVIIGGRYFTISKE